MGDVPGPSTAPYFNQRKATENFSRLCQLILTICSDLFRDILSRYIKPADLRSELDNNRKKLERIMNVQQREQIYASSGSVALTAKDLDISVLYIILRNLCNIPEHRAGWGNPPLNGDKILSACIERIRIQRNLISAHSVIAAVDDIMFQEHWDELKDAIEEVQKQSVGGDMYERGVNELFSCDLNPGRSKLYVAEFKKIQENMQIKQEKIECLESETQTAKRKIAVKKQEIKKLKTTTCRANSHLAIKKMKLNRVEKTNTLLYQRMHDNKRYIEDQLPLKFQEHEQILLSAMQVIIREESEKLQDGFKKHRQEMEDAFKKHKQELKEMIEKGSRVKKEMMEKNPRVNKDVVLLDPFLPSVIKTSTITKPGNMGVHLISWETSDILWVSDGSKCLLRLDSRGNILQRLVDVLSAFHTITDNGELLFTDKNDVKKLESHEKKSIPLFKADENIRCIHSSRINGDILVGSFCRTSLTGKVTRYDRKGNYILDIEKDNQGLNLYDITFYITENKNGDIWVSDTMKKHVVVVDKSGKHRFNYRGQQFGVFHPKGICTDILGHVLVCNDTVSDPGVHLLDQDGQFLSLLLTRQHKVTNPLTVCFDDKHNLYLGQGGSNKISVFQNLQISKK